MCIAIHASCASNSLLGLLERGKAHPPHDGEDALGRAHKTRGGPGQDLTEAPRAQPWRWWTRGPHLGLRGAGRHELDLRGKPDSWRSAGSLRSAAELETSELSQHANVHGQKKRGQKSGQERREEKREGNEEKNAEDEIENRREEKKTRRFERKREEKRREEKEDKQRKETNM